MIIRIYLKEVFLNFNFFFKYLFDKFFYLNKFNYKFLLNLQ